MVHGFDVTHHRAVVASRRSAAHDAVKRLRHLRRYGPTPQAFTVRRRFDPHGQREQTHTNWLR